MECRIQNRIKLSVFLYKYFLKFIGNLFSIIIIVFFKSHKGGSQELPLNGKDWKHDGDVQPAHVECMKVCNDYSAILPKGKCTVTKIPSRE